MKPLAFAVFTIALAASGAWAAETISVSDVRFRGHGAAAAELTERIRDAVQRAVPGARLVDGDDADLTLTGSVMRGGIGFRAVLELRDRNGSLVQRASATGSTRRELAEAMDAATADLLRQAAVALEETARIDPSQLPSIPAPLRSPAADGALDLEADADVLVAWDRARAAEARGKERPEEAAEAWREVADARGRNPFREVARARQRGWLAYADGKRGVESQRVRDSARLREVLPLASVTDSAKVEMLVKFAHAYGFDKVSPFIALLPTAPLRERAELSLDCEVKEPQACVQLARVAEEPKAALEYLDRACAAGAADVCAEVGDRWLAIEPRNVDRAIASLQSGCDAANPFACVRLARIYEEGDGVLVSTAAGAAVREKACDAGDGRSCRRLAGTTDNPARVADLLRKACDGGDSVSCALAQKEPAIVQRQLQEAAAGAKKPAPRTTANAKPAVATDKTTAPAPAPAASVPRTEVIKRDSPAVTGGALIAIGAVAGTAAFILASDDGHTSGNRYRTSLTQAGASTSDSRKTMTWIFGGAAVLSTGADLAVLLHRPSKPEEPAVGVAPTGVVISGQFH